MTIISGKALWSIICGQSVLASDEVVGIELQLAADHLKEGISYYRKFTEDAHTSWSETCKLKKHQKEFVLRIAKLLDVCSEQSWDLFQLFLEYEYRGSLSQLSAVNENDREETALLHQVFSFYLSDPLHLLSCRRHILVCDPLHPYQELFKDYVNNVLDPDGSFGSKLIHQLKDLCAITGSDGPSLHVPSSSLPLNAYHAYTSHCLAAIRHQLATLLVYYGTPGRTCSPQSVVTLLELAQGVGLGWEFLERMEGVDRSAYVGQLEAINAFHCFLLVLVLNSDCDPLSHPLCSPEWQSKVDALIQTLGSKPWHLPPLLTWVVLQARYTQANSSDMSKETERFARLSQRAIKGNIFAYLHSALKMPSFETDKFLLELAASITYSLLCSVGSYFDFDKLRLTLQINDLVQECLAFDPPSHLFWNEEGGGASIFLPPSLEAFPHNPRPLLKMATSLATAGKESCSKVVEMLKELESFTWILTDDDLMAVCISSTQCVTRSTLSPLPGIVIPAGCHGTILGDSSGHLPAVVCWQLPTNGWQILLSSFVSLEAQVKSGAIPDPWLVDTVVSGLDTMAAIVSTERQHLPLLVHLEEAALSLFVSISKTLKPSYDLIASLFKFFSGFSKESSTSVWNTMESCSLLSSLPPISTHRENQADILLGYRAGSIRSLICGEEAATGKYPILKHLCTLLESALSHDYQHANVRGTLIFVVKEVVPVMLQWRYNSVSEKVQVIEGVFSLLHQSLEEWFPHKDLQKFVVSELLQAHGGAGSTLRAVLESGASLEATLDQPAEWPQSTHSRRLTRVAQLALSLTHSLVGKYISKYEPEAAFKNSEGTSKKIWLSTGPPHLALTIAHFAYHRLNPRLPHLALRTLTHLAKEMSVPLVACLGTEAEGLRDCLITRLGSATEDLWVKVSLLQLLTTSTVNQPGLVRLFLTPPSALLEPIVTLLKAHSTPKSEASMELLAALVEAVAALWGRNYSAAASYLRDEPEFWDNLSQCLFNNSPGSVKDSLVGNVLKIFSLEYFEAKDKVCGGLHKAVQSWLEEDGECFKNWIQYIFKSSLEKAEASPTEGGSGCTKFLLGSCRDFFTLLFSRTKGVLTDQQKMFLGETAAEGLVFCFESTVEHLQVPQRILSEIHLLFIRLFKDTIVSSSQYVSCLTRILGCLRSAVMQTGSLTQVLVLAAALNALSSFTDEEAASEFSTSIVNAVILLTEQHCCLASSSFKKDAKINSTFDCSSPAVLGLACALLHQCLLFLPPTKTESLLQQSHVVYALVRAATEHSQVGNGAVAKEILRLLSLLARLSTSSDLSSNTLSTSVSLALSTQSQGDNVILSELIWCVIWCLKKEGASGLEGAVNIAAIHSPAMVNSLAAPHLQPDLALASAALTATLAPMHSLWRVSHPQCFEQLLTATACCTHRTTKLLHLKETLERELCREKGSTESSGKLSSNTILLINKLLKILITCLDTLRCLSPDFVELLSCNGMDLDAWDSLTLIQPTCRKLSTEHPSTLPNLATLADILDLCHTLVQKEGRGHTPVKLISAKSSESDVGVSIEISALNQCSEEALLLLMAHSALVLMNPNVQRREAREVRTFLADETESFFGLLLGRRQPVATSPAPPPSPGPRVIMSPNTRFLKLASQLVTSLCQSKA